MFLLAKQEDSCNMSSLCVREFTSLFPPVFPLHVTPAQDLPCAELRVQLLTESPGLALLEQLINCH